MALVRTVRSRLRRGASGEVGRGRVSRALVDLRSVAADQFAV
jgi:hypothetical protein